MFTAHYFRGRKGLSPVLQVKALRATIQDVAALSGLSICTASRALRNRPNVSVQSPGQSRGFRRQTGNQGLSLPAGRPDLVLAAGSSIEGGRLAMTERIENRGMPSASTISQPVADQGAFAANLLIERLHSSGLPNPPTSHVLETKRIERKRTCRRRR